MFVIHLAAGLIGAYLLYGSYVITEATEGKWNNRLEELWIQVDEKRRGAFGKTLYLFCRLSDFVSDKLTKLFGRGLLSWQLVGVSSALSFASFGIILGTGLVWLLSLFMKHSDKLPSNFPKQLPLLIILAILLIAIGGICLALALLPTFFKSKFWIMLSCMPFSLFVYGEFRLLKFHMMSKDQSAMSLSLAASILSDFLVVILLRKSLKWATQNALEIRIAIISALQFVAALLVLILPYKIAMARAMARDHTPLTQGLLFLVIFNVPTAVFCLAVDLLLVGMLVHRLFWPLLSQWTYALARKDVFERRKTIRSMGFVLLTYSGSGHTGFVWKLIESLK